MFRMILNFFSFCFLISFLAGCGGKTINSSQEIKEIAPAEQKLIGYWVPENGDNYEYEFFTSPLISEFFTQDSLSTTIKTGRIIQYGNVIDLFYWDLDTTGALTLNVVSANCAQRPLSFCPLVRRIYVSFQGSSIKNATWTTRIDELADGSIDSKRSNIYRQKQLEVSSFGEKEEYLTPTINTAFASPMKVWRSNDKLLLRLEDDHDMDDGSLYEKRLVVSGSIYDVSNGRLALETSGQSFEYLRNVFIKNIGYRSLKVRQTYKNVFLAPSKGAEYSLTYEVNRTILLPNGISHSDVDYSTNDLENRAFIPVERKTVNLTLINQFINNVKIRSGDKYFGAIRLDFDSAEKAGGELMFTSSNEGYLSIKQAYDETLVQMRNFTWTQQEDGSVVLNFPEVDGEVILRFTSGENGSYQVLYKLLYPGSVEDYRLTDLLLDGSSVISENELPGLYQFVGTVPADPNSYNFQVTFHKDGRVSGYFDGYWFKDINGGYVSYDCRDFYGQSITDSNICLAAFNNLSSFSLVHIRRFDILHEDGNDYRMRYSANLYINNGSAVVRNDLVALVFRMKRLEGNQ